MNEPQVDAGKPDAVPRGAVTGTLERAALVISIDVELAWGLIHRPDATYRYDDERAHVCRALDLFDRFGVPATWAFVGHLLLDGCERRDGVAHPEIVRPRYAWFDGDWLAADPCASATAAPTWYAPDMVEEIARREVGHEIGSHSFSHLIAGDPGCSEEAFRSDLRECRRAARDAGAASVSFVYPRNQYGHERVLADEGFTCYRGPRHDPFVGTPPALAGVRRLADAVMPLGATAVRPVAQHGSWNLPATYLHDVGVAWKYPARVVQARRRLAQAVRNRSLFHIWFHPHNMRHETERWFDGLEGLLERAARYRADGRLDTLTMGDIAERLGPPAAA